MKTSSPEYKQLMLLLPERCANCKGCTARSPEALWPGWTRWVEQSGPGLGYAVCPHHYRWAAEQGWVLAHVEYVSAMDICSDCRGRLDVVGTLRCSDGRGGMHHTFKKDCK